MPNPLLQPYDLPPFADAGAVSNEEGARLARCRR